MSKDFSAFVAVCVHRNVDPRCWESLWAVKECPSPLMVVKFVHGDALIERSRAIAASRFMDSDFDVLLFIDDDIIFSPADAVKLVRMVHEKDLDIVGGAYVKKQEVGTHLNLMTLDDKNLYFGKFEGTGYVQEVRTVSTGFMAIHRKVFQKMIDEEVVHLCHPNDMKFYPFFKTEEVLIDGTWTHLSEDWAFCERARRLGFKVWVDGSIKLQHVGPYKYDWDDSLRPPKKKVDFIRYWQKNGMPETREMVIKTDLTGSSDKAAEGVYQTPTGGSK